MLLNVKKKLNLMLHNLFMYKFTIKISLFFFLHLMLSRKGKYFFLYKIHTTKISKIFSTFTSYNVGKKENGILDDLSDL